MLASSKYQSPEDLNGELYGGFGIQSDKALIPAILKADGVADPKFDEVVLNTAVIDALAKERIAYSAVFTGIDDVTAELQGVKLRLFQYRDFLGAAGDYPNAVYVASDETIAERGDALKRALAALAEGYEWSAANPERGRDDPRRREQDGAEQAGEVVDKTAAATAPLFLDASGVWGPAAGRGLRGPDADPRRRRRAEGRPARAGRPVHGRAAAVGALSVAHNAARMAAAAPQPRQRSSASASAYAGEPVLRRRLARRRGGRPDRRRRPQRRRQVDAAAPARRAREEPDAGARHPRRRPARRAARPGATTSTPPRTIRAGRRRRPRRPRVGRRPRASATCSTGCSAASPRRGFPHGLDTAIAPLSGGERRRIALARLLLDGPDLLLLDEPTNHLDVEGVDWLARHLAARRGALVVVTHDRWFLDAVCTAHVGGRRRRRPRSTTAATRRGCWPAPSASAVAAVAEERRRNLLRKELAWLRRGPPARTSKPRFRIDAANALIADEPAPRDRVELLRFATARLGKLGARRRGRRPSRSASAGSCGASPGGSGRATASALVGVNGSGKTTLLRLLAGELEPRQRRRRARLDRPPGAPLAGARGARRRAARARVARVGARRASRSPTAAS